MPNCYFSVICSVLIWHRLGVAVFDNFFLQYCGVQNAPPANPPLVPQCSPPYPPPISTIDKNAADSNFAMFAGFGINSCLNLHQLSYSNTFFLIYVFFDFLDLKMLEFIVRVLPFDWFSLSGWPRFSKCTVR